MDTLQQPAQARARLDWQHDGIYALDHQAQSARLVYLCSTMHVPNVPPYHGVTAALETDRSRLRLQGYPFNGSVVYAIIV